MKYDGDTVKAWAGDSQWRAWRADLARFKKQGHSGWGSEGFWALTLYRMQRAIVLSKYGLPLLPLKIVLTLVNKIFTVVTLINLNKNAPIGPGLFIPHGGPIIVHPDASLGADCAIHQVCTVGAGAKPGAPQIGDHVMLGCHSCVLGPVVVGSRAKVGAGAVVTSDIPAGATAVGVPAKPLGKS
ncbi:MAG: hypothetical protein WBD31_03580 [Rubripirellula sp.]